MRRRRIVLFLDNYSIHPFQRRKVFESVDRSLDKLLRPGDEASLVVWYRGLKIEQPFTTDAGALRAAVKRVEETGGGMTFASERDHVRSECQRDLDNARIDHRYASWYESCLGTVRSHSEESTMIEKHLVASTKVVLNMLAGVDGKKVMIYAGSALPRHPGHELFVYADNLFLPFVPRAMPSSIGGGSSESMTFSIEGMARTANANGVTMYMIDGADEKALELSTAADGSQPDAQSAFIEYDNTAAAFQAVAQITGGMALTHTSNFDLAMNTVAQDLDSYYSLGYRQQESAKKQRNVVVKVKGHPEYRVRARQTYLARTQDEELNDKVVANIYHEAKNDLGIQMRTGEPKKQSRNRWLVPLSVAIPPTITLLPDGNDLAGGFSIFIAVGDDNGSMSDVSRIVKQVRIPAAKEAELRKRPLILTVDLSMNGGTHMLSVGVVDQLSNTSGYARKRVVVH
jgi:VWFA-related protein